MKSRIALIATLTCALLAGCSKDTSALDRAENKMAELESGRVELELSATAGSDEPTDPVGFRVEGPFSFAEDGDKAVFDLSYAQLLGNERITTQVLSTGADVYVVADGDVTEVDDDDAAALTKGDGKGLTDFAISDWIVNPKEAKSGSETRVSGTVNVSEFMADLATFSAETNGVEVPEALDDDARDRLEKLAQSSRAEVVIGDDDLPKSITIEVDFGADVPEDLEDALGPYAAAKLTLTVELSALDGPLVVKAPTN